MVASYEVQVISAPDDERGGEIDRAIAAILRGHGLHLVISVDFVRRPPGPVPNVVLCLGSATLAASEQCDAEIRDALSGGSTLLPVVDEACVQTDLPELLRAYNASFWDVLGADGVAHVILEELGVEERQRRVFISHRRSDGMMMAEQLHDELTHQHFRPFIDRFSIDPGEDVQEMIADMLEDHAFLLVIESPDSATSEYVFFEVQYALSHQMGMCIVAFPETPEIPATAGLPRVQLAEADLVEDRGHQVLKPAAMARVLDEVERQHARGIVRRRQNLLVSVQDALSSAGRSWVTLPGWRLYLPESAEVVGVTPRLPTVDDLHELDRNAHPRASVLVHAARRLREGRRDLLAWAKADRSIVLLPENAVGGHWSDGGRRPS